LASITELAEAGEDGMELAKIDAAKCASRKIVTVRDGHSIIHGFQMVFSTYLVRKADGKMLPLLQDAGEETKQARRTWRVTDSELLRADPPSGTLQRVACTCELEDSCGGNNLLEIEGTHDGHSISVSLAARVSHELLPGCCTPCDQFGIPDYNTPFSCTCGKGNEPRYKLRGVDVGVDGLSLNWMGAPPARHITSMGEVLAMLERPCCAHRWR
jgi:hypothetical protein